MEVPEEFLQQIVEAVRGDQSEADRRAALESLLQRESGHSGFSDSAGFLLLRLSEQGRHQEVQALLEHGVNPNYRDSPGGFTPLHVAVSRGDSEMVKILMKNGASASETCSTGETPLVQGETPLVLGETPLVLGETPLVQACLREDLPCVRTLLENGADPNTDSYDDGKTPLMAVVMNTKSLEVLELLLNNGADPNRLVPDSGWHLESVLYWLCRDRAGVGAEQEELCQYRVRVVRLLFAHRFRLQGHRDFLESLPELCLLHFSRLLPLGVLLLEHGLPFQPHCPWSHFDVLRKAVEKSIGGRSEAEARLLLDKANALLDRAILKPPPLRFTLRAGAVDTLPASLKSLCRALIRRSLLPCPLEPKIQTLPLPNPFRDQLRTLDQDWIRTGPGLDQDWTSTEPVLTSPRFPH